MKLDITNLIPGMELLEEVVLDQNENYILEKGHILSNRDIIKISERGIEEVYINISDEFNTFNKTFDKLVKDILKSNNIEKYQELVKVYKKVSKEIDVYQYDVSRYLSVDDKMSNHIINTINLAFILGCKYNSITDKDERVPIESLVLAAILQDIGRSAKDQYILTRLKNKYLEEIKKLSEQYPIINETIFEKYDSKYHPVYSYLISKNYDIDAEISKGILFHHEKQLGTSILGVELSKLDTNSISIKIASILKLVDLFDILLSKSVIENPDRPFKNIGKQLDKMVSSGYANAYFTNILKNIVPLYQVGQKVLLSDGTIGIVKTNDTSDYTKPLITDLNNHEIDLEKEEIEICKHYIEIKKD